MTFASLHKTQPNKTASIKRRKQQPRQASPQINNWLGFGASFSPPYPAIQPKLKIGEPNDQYEQEADRMAERVMRMPEPTPVNQMDLVSPSIGQHIQRLCPKCEEKLQRQPLDWEEEEEKLQAKKYNGHIRPESISGLQSRIQSLKGNGKPLRESVRTFFEPRFGVNFSRIRVHTGSKAAQIAQTINARAFTLGRDVVFGAGEYAPNTSEGQQLLAHELTHTIQQDASSNITQSSSGLIQRRVIPARVSCHNYGLRNPNLTGAEAVAAIEAADTDAINLALRAENLLEFELLLTQAGEPVNARFDAILQQELGLTLTNPAHYQLIEQQIERFRDVREGLESGYFRYLCRGGTVSLAGCTPETCNGPDFAFSCPANRLIVLCQQFWNTPDQRSATILHEPFHILFGMARHAPNALRRADASCFESFALRVAGRAAFTSCVGHTRG